MSAVARAVGWRRGTSVVLRATVALATLTVGVAACAANPDSLDLSGTEVEVLGVWQDAEQAAFEQVLGLFEQRTGATVSFLSTAGDDLAIVLEERLAAGDPPDIAVVPQPGLLRDLARSGSARPIGTLVGERVERDWAPIWPRLGSVDGELYGVWYKAAHKSLVWYSIHAFEQVGVVPPDDLAGLTSIADQLSAANKVAFSVATGGERERLWQRWLAIEPETDAFAHSRSVETPVVVFEPRRLPSGGVS